MSAGDGGGVVEKRRVKREKGEGPRYIHVPPRLKPEPAPPLEVRTAEPIEIPEAIDLPQKVAETAVKVAPNVSIEALTRVAGALGVRTAEPVSLDILDRLTTAFRAMEADHRLKLQIEQARREEIKAMVQKMIQQQEEDDVLLMMLI